jgi:hypothetical protein
MYTKHAEVRMQQRGISRDVVELLLRYGNCRENNCGGEIYSFSKKARKRVARKLERKALSRLDHCWDAYAVLCEGQIVTCGHRTQRFRN